MAASRFLQEEIEDLTTCCICLLQYDDGDHKPKYLSCFHTVCLICIKEVLRQAQDTPGDDFINCPKCRLPCYMPDGGPEKLRSDPNPLIQIQLRGQLNNNGRWCVDCSAIPSLECEGAHSIVDMRGLTGEAASIRKQATTHFKAALVIREQLERQSHNRADQLRRESEAAEVEEEEHRRRREDLARKLKKCETSKRESWLPGQHVNFGLVLEGAKKTLKDAEKEFEEAQDLQLVASHLHPAVTEPLVSVSPQNQQTAPIAASTSAQTSTTFSTVGRLLAQAKRTQGTVSLFVASGITRSKLLGNQMKITSQRTVNFIHSDPRHRKFIISFCLMMVVASIILISLMSYGYG